MDRNASYGSSRNIFDHHSRRSEFDNYGDATPQCYKDQADTERIDSGYDSIHWERCSSLSSHLSSLHLSTGSTSKTSDSGTFGMNGPKGTSPKHACFKNIGLKLMCDFKQNG